jgi:8-hydroxy-5-deazaflavin:NADPH oxidoreductase
MTAVAEVGNDGSGNFFCGSQRGLWPREGEAAMRIGVLGTGGVGKALASRLVELGHEVVMGSRTAGNADAAAWAEQAGRRASSGTFDEAAAAGEVLLNCTAGVASLEALASVDEANLDGKVLIDVANSLDFSAGFPPRLSVSGDDSLAEQIQRAHPGLRVVKSLNTMSSDVMVRPELLAGDHVVFTSGDDADAKAVVAGLLRELGWPEAAIVDLGDLSTARGTEQLLPLWVRLYGVLGTNRFNIGIVREGAG